MPDGWLHKIQIIVLPSHMAGLLGSVCSCFFCVIGIPDGWATEKKRCMMNSTAPGALLESLWMGYQNTAECAVKIKLQWISIKPVISTCRLKTYRKCPFSLHVNILIRSPEINYGIASKSTFIYRWSPNSSSWHNCKGTTAPQSSVSFVFSVNIVCIIKL